MIGISAAWIVMILVVNPIGDFPLNDDWVYGGAARSLLTGDGFRIPGPTITDIIAQAVWGAAFCVPFGFSYTALRVSTLTLGLVGLWFCYALQRENGVNPRLAWIATAALAVCPLWLDLANSFMTDVPFATLMLAALYSLIRFLRDDSWVWLVAGVLISIAAVLTRQVGVAILLAFAVANGLKFRWRIGPLVLGALPLLIGVAVHLAWQSWLMSTGRGPEVQFAGISPYIPWDVARLLLRSTEVTIVVAPYVGFALIPIVVITGLPRFVILGAVRPRLVHICFGLICLVALVGLRRSHNVMPALGNVIIGSGVGPLTQFDTYVLHLNLPIVTAATKAFWYLVTVLGLVGIAAFVVVTAQSVQRRLPRLWRGDPAAGDWVWIMAALTGAAYWAAILLLIYHYDTCFDRYVIPLIPVALIMMSLGHPGGDPAAVWRTTVAGTLLFLTGALSATATADYLEWNRTRWVALRHLTEELGIPLARIDGGYEFNGSMLYEPNYEPPPGKSSWWVHDNEYTLASGPLPGYRELICYDVAKWLPVGVKYVFVLKRSNADDR